MSNPYYVYYDSKTTAILSVTNEKNDSFESGIIVTYEEVEKFLNGQWHIKDFKVDHETGSSELKILSNFDQSLNFENNEFTVIRETDTKSEFIVEWDLPNKQWVFILDDTYRKTFNGVFNACLTFFVTLENDLDFLIRTIVVDTNDLVYKGIAVVPFEEDIEEEINRISISSKMIFKNYKLRIVHE